MHRESNLVIRILGTDLDHLPPAMRREPERVVRLLFEKFADATALAQQSWEKQSRVLKVILYVWIGAEAGL